MICVIYVRAGSATEARVRARLNRSTPEGLQPFFINRYVRINDPLVDRHPIVFAHPYCMPMVYAQMEIETYEGSASSLDYKEDISPPDPPSSLRRTNSAPGYMQGQPKMLGISQCTQTRCPISLERIRPGNDVFILKSTEAALRAGEKIPCISGDSLRDLVAQTRPNGFIDPLRREDQRLLSIHEDYNQYIIFIDWDDPTCPRTPGVVSPQTSSDDPGSTPQRRSSSSVNAGESSHSSTSAGTSGGNTPPTRTSDAGPSNEGAPASDTRVSIFLPHANHFFIVFICFTIFTMIFWLRKKQNEEVYLEFV